MRLRRCDCSGRRVLEEEVRHSACAVLCRGQGGWTRTRAFSAGGLRDGSFSREVDRGHLAYYLTHLNLCLLRSHESGHRHGLREPLFIMSSFCNNRKQISALSLFPCPPETHRNLSPRSVQGSYSPLPHTSVHHVEGAASWLICTASSGRKSSARS